MITHADTPTLDLPPAILTGCEDMLDNLISARWDGGRRGCTRALDPAQTTVCGRKAGPDL